MAEMLVDGAKLDACLDAEADAIRAKTGDSNDLPFDFANNKGFADAIAAIETGGGALPSWMHIAEVTVVSATNKIQIPCDKIVDSCFAISSEFVTQTVLGYQYILFQYYVPTLRPYDRSIMTKKSDGNTDYWQQGNVSYRDGVATIYSGASKYYYGAGVKYTFVLFNKGGA